MRWQGLGPQALGLSTDRLGKETLVGLGFSTLYIIVFMINNTLWGSPPDVAWLLGLIQNFSYQHALNLARWAGELLVKAFFVGVYEEIVFRGWVLTFLLTRWGVGEKALAVSALFFGLVHFHMGWWAMLVTTMFGYVCGLLYLWRKHLAVPIVLHILWNWAVWLGLLGRPS
ncbi:MAG: CPBP family intramembrane glutamic endopeptidase [Candidatus Bipolaricaulota bacterium]|nr:CPBP family intramembrane glutamic endopeptidase [Candidatus Bipolaricaulota bacterium]